MLLSGVLLVLIAVMAFVLVMMSRQYDAAIDRMTEPEQREERNLIDEMRIW